MTATSAAVSARPKGSSEKPARKAVGGAFAGFFVDMFDVYLPA